MNFAVVHIFRLNAFRTTLDVFALVLQSPFKTLQSRSASASSPLWGHRNLQALRTALSTARVGLRLS
jgi:hypothetical protein